MLKAAKEQYPNARAIEWDFKELKIDGVIVDYKQFEARALELQAEYEATEYQRKRKAEYDALNQFELMFDDQANGTQKWVQAIQAIKTKYPKPS